MAIQEPKAEATLTSDVGSSERCHESNPVTCTSSNPSSCKSSPYSLLMSIMFIQLIITIIIFLLQYCFLQIMAKNPNFGAFFVAQIRVNSCFRDLRRRARPMLSRSQKIFSNRASMDACHTCPQQREKRSAKTRNGLLIYSDTIMAIAK